MFDIYGQTLKPGHCEVHPVVGVPSPCPMCHAEMDSQRVINQQPDQQVWSGEENPRIQEYQGVLDDFLATDVQSVHFEANDDSQWYATITMRGGEVWQLKFGAKNPAAKGYAFAEQVY